MAQRPRQTSSVHPFNVLFLAQEETAERWRAPLEAALAGESLHWTPAEVDPDRVDVVLTAVPPPGALAPFRRLRLIQSLWMGVDSLLADETLPGAVPIARMIDPTMTRAMVESALAHALAAHLRLDEFARLQRERRWRPLRNPTADRRRVGVLGLGELGAAVAHALAGLGFRVAGWSRTSKDLAGVRCLAGPGEFDEFLGAADILIVLLPLTPATRGIVDRRLLAALPRGAVLINLARGALVNDTDLLAALDAGKLRHAVLDVFGTEPLPAQSAYWAHPHVTVTPHVAAVTDPSTAAEFVAANLRRLRAGEPLAGLVDRRRGY